MPIKRILAEATHQEILEDENDYLSESEREHPLKIQPHFDTFKKSLKLYGLKENDVYNTWVRRNNESTNLFGKHAYENFTESLDMQSRLLQAVAELTESIKTVKPAKVSGNFETNELVKDAKINLVIAMRNSEVAIRALTAKLITNPIKTVPTKDIKLLYEATLSVIDCYKNPHDKQNLYDLAVNCQQVFKKMGSYWKSIKTALITVVGAACILIGAASLLPSFGASIALIAIGSALCAYGHLPGFISKTSLANQQIKTADQVSHEMNNILITTKKLLNFKEAKVVSADHTKPHRSTR